MKAILRGIGVAGATLTTLGLAWVPATAASRQSSSPAVASAAPGQQLWATTMPGSAAADEAVSPNGATVFVTGYLGTHFETVAYRASTGAQLWATAYRPAGFSNARAISVSPDGATVYVTGDTLTAKSQGYATVAYAAGTGRQLWVSRHLGGAIVNGLAVSPDGSTVYVAGFGRNSASQLASTLIAYAARTGAQRWVRYYPVTPSRAESVAVSPDGKTVYITGSAGPSVLTVAYRASGTVKWANRYKNPYSGSGSGYQIAVGPGGGSVYVVGRAPNKSGHLDLTTFAYRASTGQRLWLDRYDARAGLIEAYDIAVTPSGRAVIVVGPRNGGRSGGYALASYNASTGRTLWTRTAPVAAPYSVVAAGLVINARGNTVYVAGTSRGYDTKAYSVADGAVRWTARYAHGAAAAIALTRDGTRLFVTGSWPDHGMTTVAYKA